MSSIGVEAPKSSLRDRFKDKLSLSTTIRLPKFLSGEPASPARYQGKPFWTPSPRKEQWYFPPTTPPRQDTKHEDLPTARKQPQNVVSPKPRRDFRSSNLDGILSPRIQESPQVFFTKAIEPMSQTLPADSLVIRDQRPRVNGDSIHGEPCSRVLQDLIQKIPSTWLTTPRIKEAFISLLRNNENTLAEKAPTPRELRLIDGFLQHLPELHIVQQKRVKRKQPTNPAAQEYKRSLLLNSHLVDEFEKANPRTHVMYAILIIATIIHEISTWIIQQLVHSGTIVPENIHPDLPLLVQHGVFGGVLIIEVHAGEDPQMAFMDLAGELWGISVGWLLFKYAEGPEGMPFNKEKMFQMRRFGVLRRVGGAEGGLQGSE